jgi:AraC-like DNA-binding protein
LEFLKVGDESVGSFREITFQPTEGTGKIVIHNIFNGVHLAFINIYASALSEQNMKFPSRQMLINYCVNGRCELLLEDDTYTYIKSGDLSVSTQGAKNQYIYPTKCYEGVEIFLDAELLSAESEHLLDAFGISFSRLEKEYCGNGKTYVGQAKSEIEMIMSKIWALAAYPSSFYMQLHLLELLHLLLKEEQHVTTRTLYTGIQVEIAKKAEQLLTADIREHYPIKQIAEQFSVSETSIKNYFRGVYGQNISTYLRELRMNTAASLLAETQTAISEVAIQVGYANQGKFAAVFKKQFGLSPLEYRRFMRLAEL